MSPASRISLTPLDPADYRRSPWKNGGGVTIDIAGEWRPGDESWRGTIWRLGRTSIVAPGAFSDLSGYDRLQAVVKGRGLSLLTPGDAIDLSEPWRPARFSGDTPIVSHLSDGAVEVVNLIGDRARVAIDLVVLTPDDRRMLDAGMHVIYAPDAAAEVTIDGEPRSLAADHAILIDARSKTGVLGVTGRALIASATKRS